MRPLQYCILSLLVIALPITADPRFEPEPEGARQARNEVGQVLIGTWQRVLDSQKHSPTALTNAPISGFSDKRGRHLLSFSAFNGFTSLAQWGLENGADINVGDKDNATMLRMSLGNYNPDMVGFSLDNGANPNLQMGQGDDTMLSGLMRWGWPLSGFKLAMAHEARPRSEDERQKVLSYLQNHDAGGDLMNHFSSIPLVTQPIATARKGQLIETDMILEMDSDLLAAISNKSPGLNDSTLERFYIKGKGFEAFLAFNGFFKSLIYRLDSMTPEVARAAVKRLDLEGNDLLVATIKSLNADAVEAVLKVTSETVNNRIAMEPYYYSKGMRPLHMAVQWEVPDRVFLLLIDHGADPLLTSSSNETPLELLQRYHKDNYVSDEQYQRMSRLLAPQVN